MGSLAWPSVVLVLLFVLRKHLGGLAERLDELSLPGGAKATFRKRLDELRQETESLPPTPEGQEEELPETDEIRYLRLAAVSPEAAIVEGYKSVEDLIFNRVMPLIGVRALNPAVIVNEMVKRELIDRQTLDLFQSLRQTRNAAAHAMRGAITANEAMDYWESVRKLISRLNSALQRIQVEAR